jgi:hypothetical protein
MKKSLLIAVLVVTLVSPGTCFGFGLFKYTVDAIANQLGLDRGPVPKAIPKASFDPCNGRKDCPKGTANRPPRLHIQADGF